MITTKPTASGGLTIEINGSPAMTMEPYAAGFRVVPLHGPQAGTAIHLPHDANLRDERRYSNSGTFASVGDRVCYDPDDDRSDHGSVVGVDGRGWATVEWDGPTATQTYAPSDLHLSD